MSISVTEPVTKAIDKTKEILFRPFDGGKWLSLGLCAFLAHLGSGGGGGNFNFNFGGRGSSPSLNRQYNQFSNWIDQNWPIVLTVVIVLFVFGLLLSLLISWLSARGQFMFIDGVVKNRAAVREPWNEYKPEGNSLFRFKICYGLGTFLLFALVAGICFLIALSDFKAKEFGVGAIVAVIIFALFMMLFILTAIVIEFLLHDFVVPAMYRRRIPVLQAWSVVRQSISGHVGTVILFFFFQILLGFAVGVLGCIATFVTCCFVIIPYVGTVILLPLIVFMRCYTLFFIEQFGPEWQFFQTPELPTIDDSEPHPLQAS